MPLTRIMCVMLILSMHRWLNSSILSNIPPNGGYVGRIQFTGTVYSAVFCIAPEILDNYSFSVSEVDVAGVGFYKTNLYVERWNRNAICVSSSELNKSDILGNAVVATITFTKK